MPLTESPAETPLNQTVPDSIQTSLRALSVSTLPPPANGHHAAGEQERNGHRNGHQPDPPVEPRLSLAADLTAAGSYGERWLVVDQSHVRVLSPNGDGPAHVDLDLPLATIAEARTESLVGCGALLLVRKDGHVLEAVRYTLAQAPTFGAAARVLQAFLQDEEPPEAMGQDLQKKVCPRCGDPLGEDTDVCPKCVDKKATLARLFGYAGPYRVQMLVITTLMLLATGLGLVQPIFQKYLIDDVLIPHRHPTWIAWIVLAVVAVNLLSLALTIWRGRLSAWMTNHMVFALRTEAYDRLQALSLSYYDKRQTGALMARVTQDVNELQSFLVDGIQLFLINTLTILGVLVILMRFNWQLTLLVLLPVPLTTFLARRVWKLLWGRMHRLYFLRAGLNAAVNAALSGVRVVKAFAQEEREAVRFRDRAFGLFAAGVVVEQSWATYFPLIGFLTTLGVYIIWYVGGRQVFANPSLSHGMTVGVLGMFLSYIFMLLAPLQQMTRIADWLSRSMAAAERVFEVIDAEPDIQDTSDSVAMPRLEGRVELRGVTFSYDKNQNVLEDVSLTVEAGEMIGLVGHSGAGKSTFINLLSRFYDVREGQILIDGVDIRKIKTEDLRRQIWVVLQEPFLFPGTIAHNIAYAKSDATPAEIMRAAKAANAHDFVMRFADGYDTFVGERGARLSGGERQRLSIARAILHDPRILILDEATASVDTETEKQIQEAMARLIQGRTTFAIAHRLSTLRNASRLLVLERGKLVELGTHDELLANPDGVFKRLVDMQQQVNALHAV